MKKLYDLTKKLNSSTLVFPGDPCFQSETINAIDINSNFALQKLQFSNHSGTHIDFPSHVIKNGKSSVDFPINYLTGKGIIVECPPHKLGKVSSELITSQSIYAGDIVFFKNVECLELEAAQLLLSKKVKIIGVDGLSIDSVNSDQLPVHHLLLRNNVLIVESLNLSEAPFGRCEILIAPLNIESDGAPARVVMWK